MGYGVYGPGFHLSMAYDKFECPKCKCEHSGEDYDAKLQKSKKSFIYIKCKGCKTKIGVTTDMMGDVQIWLKDEEYKDKSGNMVAPSPWYPEGEKSEQKK